MFGFAQLMMRKTEIVAASDQIHTGLQRVHPTSGMTGFTCQAGQPFPERSIQTLDESSIQDAATLGEQKQFLRLSYRPMGHLARDLDHSLFLGSLDYRANLQLRPDPQTGSPNSTVLLDLLTEGPTNTVGVGTPAVCQHQ